MSKSLAFAVALGMPLVIAGAAHAEERGSVATRSVIAQLAPSPQGPLPKTIPEAATSTSDTAASKQPATSGQKATADLQAKVRALIQSRKHDEAIKLVTDEIAAKGRTVSLLVLLSDTNCQANRIDVCLREASAAIEVDKNSTAALMHRADIYFRLERGAEALPDVDAAIRLEPTNATPLVLRGLIDRQIGKFEESLSDFDKALGLNPRAHLAYQGRAGTYLAMKRFSEAEKAADDALAIEPNLAESLAIRGMAALKRGDSNKARADFTKANGLNSRNLRAIQGLMVLNVSKAMDVFADSAKAGKP